jgi:hypothetical protein
MTTNSVISYSKVFAMICYLFMMVILIQTYYYLIQIDNCPCFNKNDKYSVNIEFMKYFQILEMIVLTIFVTISYITSNKFKNIIPKSGGIFLSTLSAILLLGISSYMAYNTLNFYINVKEDCKCANSMYKYFVYFEGISSLVAVVRMIFMILLVFIMLILFYNQVS